MNTIMVVEDDPSIGELLVDLLKEEGFGAVLAGNGAEAMALLAHTPCDLLLLDLMMPVMDGREFLRRYRRMPGPHVPVIVKSAGRQFRTKPDRRIDLATILGEDQSEDDPALELYYLPAPFDLVDLLDLLDTVGPRRPEAEAAP